MTHYTYPITIEKEGKQYYAYSEDLPGVFVVAFQIPANAPVGNDITFSVSVTPAGSSTSISSAASKVPVGSIH